jgi:hypothetical protein
MLATMVYAINPKQSNPVDGFVSFSKSEKAALKRKEQIIGHIKNGGYKNWPSADRKYFVDRCQKNNWEIKVVLCTY